MADKPERSVKAPGVQTPTGRLVRVVRLWVIPLLSLAILIVVSTLVIRPWFDDINEKRMATEEQQVELERLVQKLEALQQYELSSLREYLIQLGLAVPSQSSPPTILATIEQALNEAGLTIEAVQFGGLSNVSEETLEESDEVVGDQTEEDPVEVGVTPTATPIPEQVIEGGQVEIQFTTEGELAQVITFLKTIQRVNPLILPVNFTVQGAGSFQQNEESPTGLKTFLLSGTAPFQELPQNLGALSASIESLSASDLQLIQELENFVTYFVVGNEAEVTGSEIPIGKTNPF